MNSISSDAVMGRFFDRVREDLVSNNMLRGSWAEEVVAAFLGVTELPGQWNYFDMRDTDGRTISVKQSVGPRAKFDVTGRPNAWDNELAERLRLDDPKAEGWLPNPDGEPRRWCDVYVFAHLPGELDAHRVADVEAWRFAARSVAWMNQLPPSTKSLSVSRLDALRVPFVRGDDLRQEIERSLTETPT